MRWQRFCSPLLPHPRNDGARKLYGSLGFDELEWQACARSPEGKILAVRKPRATDGTLR